MTRFAPAGWPRRHQMTVFLWALGAIALIASAPAETADRLPGPIPARVVEVIDGDTVTVRAQIWLGQEIQTRVRLAGADAPELKARCPQERVLAERARDFLVRRLSDGDVMLRDVRHDKYGGRVVARLETPSGEDLARSLIAAGLARAYAGEARRPWCV
jgi:endonuclease YncB( thermonuclease family)